MTRMLDNESDRIFWAQLVCSFCERGHPRLVHCVLEHCSVKVQDEYCCYCKRLIPRGTVCAYVGDYSDDQQTPPKRHR